MASAEFRVVAHADWSKTPSKRWMVQAFLEEDGRYRCHAPQKVERPATFLAELRDAAGSSACALVGFDFPIGLPLAYAQRVGITDFLKALPDFGKGEWYQFYKPACSPKEIDLYRPFYPDKTGAARLQHLEVGLGIARSALRRQCELAHGNRRAACPLFWTMGAQQVGKAAISGWQQVFVGRQGIAPFVSIWPFSGPLEELALPGKVVIAETYPAEFYKHLKIDFKRRQGEQTGKRVQADRQKNAGILLEWASAHIQLTSELHQLIQNGFGPSPEAEDAFDATIGLFGMLNVILGARSAGQPDELRRPVEGWIFGLEWDTYG